LIRRDVPDVQEIIDSTDSIDELSKDVKRIPNMRIPSEWVHLIEDAPHIDLTTGRRCTRVAEKQ